MKKFVAMLMMVVVIITTNAAFAAEPHRIEGLYLDEDFRYHNDSRLHVDGFEYDDGRQDLYIYVGSAFKIRTSNVEEHDIVRIDYIRTTEKNDVILYSDFCTYEEATSDGDCTARWTLEFMIAYMLETMERHGWD